MGILSHQTVCPGTGLPSHSERPVCLCLWNAGINLAPHHSSHSCGCSQHLWHCSIRAPWSLTFDPGTSMCGGDYLVVEIKPGPYPCEANTCRNLNLEYKQQVYTLIKSASLRLWPQCWHGCMQTYYFSIFLLVLAWIFFCSHFLFFLCVC